MSQGVQVGKYRAVFPPGYVERSWWYRAHAYLGRRSRRLRALVFGALPYSRPRTHLVARFFHEIVAAMGERRYDHFIPAVHPEAEVELWGLGTYHGRDGWQAALSEWLDAFDVPSLEMTEFLDPGGGQVLCVGTVGGAVKGTGVPIENKLYFLVRVEDGMAVRGRLYESKQDALEAVGLRE